jgi:hypothetical protein
MRVTLKRVPDGKFPEQILHGVCYVYEFGVFQGSAFFTFCVLNLIFSDLLSRSLARADFMTIYMSKT